MHLAALSLRDWAKAALDRMHAIEVMSAFCEVLETIRGSILKVLLLSQNAVNTAFAALGCAGLNVENLRQIWCGLQECLIRCAAAKERLQLCGLCGET